MKLIKRLMVMITTIIIIGVSFYVILTNLTGKTNVELDFVDKPIPKEDILEEVFAYPINNDTKNVQRITISATGDIMFHTPQITAAYKNGGYNFDENFAQIKNYFQDADLAIGNFESTTGGGNPSGYPMFNAPDETLTTLSDVGFDVLSTANNHALDTGKSGVIRTIENIEKNNMVNIGTYREPGEHVYIRDVDGINLGILSYTYGLNGMEGVLSSYDRSYMINLIKEEKIKADISKAEELGADSIIIIIHWGNEYQLNPSDYQVELANKIFKWGGDIILGSHPHVVQKSEMITVNGEMKYVIYSMGNFISNQRRETLEGYTSNSEYTEDGVIVNITLEKDFSKDETRIINVKNTPTWVDRQVINGKFKYQVLSTKDTTEFARVQDKLISSYNNTISKMVTYRYFGE